MISGPWIERKFAPASFATAFAISVFPVPGGPYRRTPFGGSMPRRSKSSPGLSGGLTISRDFPAPPEFRDPLPETDLVTLGDDRRDRDALRGEHLRLADLDLVPDRDADVPADEAVEPGNPFPSF